MKNYDLLTSESVTEGHPDKICDIISDTLLDAYLAKDPGAHVALETMVSDNLLFIAGEIASKAEINVKKIVKEAIADIGYDRPEKGLDAARCLVISNIKVQSPDIAQGVNQTDGLIGAGDQGMMIGYACDETEELMPLSITLAHKLSKRLAFVRKEGILPYLYPDGKTQVTVAYDEEGRVAGIKDVVVSAQHCECVCSEQLQEDIQKEVINAVLDPGDMLPDGKIHINPTGRFVIGGPVADTGLTGRKLMVDTYGGIAPHGGGAFSGKDPTKVDRSASYMARYAAKNVVAAGLCNKCEIRLAYAIGVPQPVSVRVHTFGTEEFPKDIIEQVVKEVFDFSVAGIIRNLSLTSVSYRPVAAYGHFGRSELNLPWERTDKAPTLTALAVEAVAERICQNSISCNKK